MKRLTPEEIFNKEFKHALRGYDIDEANEFLDLVIQSYEDVLKENEYLKEKIKKFKKGGGDVFTATGRPDTYDKIISEILTRLEHLEKIVLR